MPGKIMQDLFGNNQPVDASQVDFYYAKVAPDGSTEEPYDDQVFAKVTPCLHHGGRTIRKALKEGGKIVLMPVGGFYDVYNPQVQDEHGKPTLEFKLIMRYRAATGRPAKPVRTARTDENGNPIARKRRGKAADSVDASVTEPVTVPTAQVDDDE